MHLIKFNVILTQLENWKKKHAARILDNIYTGNWRTLEGIQLHEKLSLLCL